MVLKVQFHAQSGDGVTPCPHGDRGFAFSIRCNVIRDMPATSAATVALTPKALRFLAIFAPSV